MAQTGVPVAEDFARTDLVVRERLLPRRATVPYERERRKG